MGLLKDVDRELGPEIIALIEDNNRFIGYKGFEKNLTCRGLDYKIGETIEIAGDPKVFSNGAHFCQEPLGVDKHYPFKQGYRYCIVEALGKVNTDYRNDTKVSTNKLKLLREISEREMKLIQIHYSQNIDKKIMEGVYEFQRRNKRM